MMHRYLKVHAGDNVLVALSNLNAGENIEQLILKENIPAKHKFNTGFLKNGDPIIMSITVEIRVNKMTEKKKVERKLLNMYQSIFFRGAV